MRGGGERDLRRAASEVERSDAAEVADVSTPFQQIVGTEPAEDALVLARECAKVFPLRAKGVACNYRLEKRRVDALRAPAGEQSHPCSRTQEHSCVCMLSLGHDLLRQIEELCERCTRRLRIGLEGRYARHHLLVATRLCCHIGQSTDLTPASAGPRKDMNSRAGRAAVKEYGI